MSERDSVSPPALALSQSMVRTVASLRRTIKALYHVHPEHESDTIAALSEQLETEITSAGTMGLGQPSESRHTRSPLAGSMNPMAPPVVYEYGDGSIRGDVRFHEGYQGPPACVHGGFVAALLDDGLGRTRHLTGRNCVTGSLNITYKRPTPINADLVIEARIEEIFERKFRVTGEILYEGLVTASAEAIFVFRDTEKFNALVSEARDASR
jgi:acyl-coenzyme A thioesterase PaaI-like protein